MKKSIIIITLVSLMLSVTGCEDMKCLQEEPIREATEGFMDDAEKIESVLYSAYYQAKRYNCFSRYYHTVSEALSDYAEGNGSYAEISKYQGCDPTIVSRTSDVWACLYRSIRFCNTIIYYAPDAKNATAEEIKHLVAEARFMRAFDYLFLVQSFGDVLLIDENNMFNVTEDGAPRTAASKILEFIAEDLVHASENLPDQQNIAGRPQKTTALTLLTEVYLHQHEWAKASETAKKVIDSGKYRLVEVSKSDDFYKIFHPDLVTSTEEIFYFKYRDGKEYGSAFAAMLHRGEIYYNGSNYYGIWSSWDYPFMSEWDDADLRKSFNIYEYEDEGNIKIYNKKFIATNAEGDCAGNDYTFYRYADLLLYYAEAECRANGGPTADGMEKLNMVHRRAYGKPSSVANTSVDFKLSDYQDEEAFLNLVLKERGYETCYEGKRFNDLKRMGKLSDEVLKQKGITVSENAYLFAIPYEEFLYNPQIDPNKDQNPGY